HNGCPESDIGAPVLEISAMRTIAKFSPLLHEELNQLGVLVEELEVSAGTRGNLVDVVCFARCPFPNICRHCLQAAIESGEKELLLGRESRVDGAFADSEPVGQLLDVGCLVAVLGEALGSGLKNCFITSLTNDHILFRTATFGIWAGRCFGHGFI